MTRFGRVHILMAFGMAHERPEPKPPGRPEDFIKKGRDAVLWILWLGVREGADCQGFSFHKQQEVCATATEAPRAVREELPVQLSTLILAGLEA